MKIAYYDASGAILRSLEVPDNEAHFQPINPGESVYHGEHELHDRIVDGQLVPGAPPEATYADKRVAEYPRIADQLDALWHAMEDGHIPVAPEFFEMIKAVKDRNPNPDAVGKVVL